MYNSNTEAVRHLPEALHVFDSPPFGDQEMPGQ